jgi:formylglycine-generating enzyme required for sulfatase activity/pimeloyl-ACP methyl ester carboxylesterase
LTTIPEGAEVFVQPYAAAPDAGWESLGRTPLKGVRLPIGVFQIRIDKEGYEPRTLAATNPSALLGNATNRLAAPVVTQLTRAGSASGMVEIPSGAFPVSLNAFSTTDPIPLDAYWIDRFEVSNEQYRQFVDANGYAHAAYWEDLPFELAGRRVSWDQAVAIFRDSTGAHGPATWVSGRYPRGTGANPVGGVSWYEAVAYCRSQRKMLPTLYHWRRAALAPDEMFSPLAPAILERSNFEQRGPADVGTFRGLGPYGTFDMAGNVREWSWNEARPGDRWIQGGSWREPEYMLVVPDRVPALDRSPINGFRCARYGTEIPERLLARLDRPFLQLPARAAIPELFDVFKSQYQPITAPLNQRVEAIDASHTNWTKEKMSFDAGYEDARVATYLFIPKTAKPPFQAVVYFPGRSSFVGRSRSDALQPDILEFVVDSGRVLVWPIYQGSYERWIPTATPSAAGRRLLSDWRQDLARVLDVLSQRPDIDATRIAYLGLSYGASVPVPLLALEDRFKAVVLMSAAGGGVPGFADADALDYLGRITMPVLLLSGKHDFVFPLETIGKPLFARLGTRPENKRHVVFDAGHMMFPRGPMNREVLGWLDRYLGPVTRP